MQTLNNQKKPFGFITSSDGENIDVNEEQLTEFKELMREGAPSNILSSKIKFYKLINAATGHIET